MPKLSSHEVAKMIDQTLLKPFATTEDFRAFCNIITGNYTEKCSCFFLFASYFIFCDIAGYCSSNTQIQ